MPVVFKDVFELVLEPKLVPSLLWVALAFADDDSIWSSRFLVTLNSRVNSCYVKIKEPVEVNN